MIDYEILANSQHYSVLRFASASSQVSDFSKRNKILTANCLSNGTVFLSLCVGSFICGVCFFIVSSSSFLLLVPREGCICFATGISWLSSLIFL